VRAGLALAAALLAFPADAQGQSADSVLDAVLREPTARYAHAVLGDALEWAALDITYRRCTRCRSQERRRLRVRLPETRVFEDITARVVDADGDGLREVIVVETDLQRGAALAVYGPPGRIAITAFLGARDRWLAPAGVGDFDGDGRTEIAWVERPHADRVLVIGRLEGGRIIELARAGGFSNHRIGEDVITGSVHRCGNGDRLVLPDAGWQRWQEVRLDRGTILAADAGPLTAAPAVCG
jgi:hypothetical protein